MRILSTAFAVAALSLASPCLLAGLEGSLEFSLDSGKTWSQDFPVLKSPGALDVKLTWSADETRPVEMSVVTAKLFSRERDFASANRGKQSWGPSAAWYQDPAPSYCGLKDAKPFICHLDLGARPEGQSGKLNKWSVEKKAYEDAPLAACKAFPPGSYRFSFEAGYTLVEGRQRVSLVKDFEVSIAASASAQTPVSAPSVSQALVKEEALPALTGEAVFGVERVKGLRKSPEGPLCRADGKDLYWRLEDVKPGEYRLRLLVESGSGHGEDQLALRLPFVFLNGKPVHFERASGLELYKGAFFAVIETSSKVHLEPGDQIRWNKQRRGQFGALALADGPLPCAPIWVEQFTEELSEDLYRIEGSFDGKLSASVSNVSGQPKKAHISSRVLDYFQNEVFKKDFDAELPDGGKLQVESPAIREGSSQRYRAIVEISDADGLSAKKSFDWLSGSKEGFRPVLWLNSGWEWTSLADDGTLKTRTLQPLSSIPQKAEWKKIELPGNWQDYKPNDHVAFFRKSFEAPPEALRSERAVLRFSRIAYEADIYVNGEKAGSSSASSYVGAAEIDVSGKLKPGENRIDVCIRGKIAALEERELERKSLELGHDAKLRGPVGLCSGIDDVRLLGLPAKAIGDVFVKSSWRAKTLSVELDAPALPGGVVSSRVLLRGKELLRLPDLKAGEAPLRLKTETRWETPELWGPDEFPLLQLVTELKDGTGRLVDRKDTRFGFREIWAEGMDLKWNGKTVKFASRPFLSTWSYNMTARNKADLNRETLVMVKTLGCKMLRHIYNPESFAEIADEEGVLIAQGGSTISGHTKQQLESEEFWSNVASNAISGILSARNHPSIFTWYLSNEYFGESEDRCSERLAELGRKVEAFDDTRFFEFGCDMDLRGRSKLISAHYPVDLSALRAPEAYLPESAYWRRFGQSFEKGMNVPAGMCKKTANVYADSPVVWGTKPIIVNECCWVSFFNPPDGFSSFASDWVYSSPSAVSIAHTMANKWFGYGDRDAGASAITMWKHLSQDPVWDSLPEVDIDVLQRFTRLYGGIELELDLNLIHDRFKEESLDFSAVLSCEGKELRRFAMKEAFDYCQLKRLNLKFALPDTKTAKSLKLNFSLSSAGKSLCSKEIDLKVFPASLRDLSVPPKTGLLSNDKTLIRTLPSAMAVAEPGDLSGLERVVVGGDVSLKDLERYREALLSFADAGGHVIFLERDFPPDWTPGGLIQTGRVASIGYSFRPGHRYLEGLSEDDLRFWFPEHRISGQCFRKPVEGNFRSVVEAGGPNGLVYTALGSIDSGRGLFTFCQLRLDVEKNPVAALLLGNILKAKGQELPESEAEVIAPSDSSLRKAMASMGVQARDVKSPSPGSPSPVVVDASKGLSDELADSLRSAAMAGRTVILHGVGPEAQKAASKIVGTAVEASPVQAQAWQGRALRLDCDAVSAGVTNFDLFWRKRPETESYGGTFFLKQEVAATLGDWALSGDGLKRHFYPALLCSAACGKGRVIFDNLNWSEASSSVKDNAKRIAIALLTNAGVKIVPSRKRKLPENLSFSPLDLSRFMNRSFADDIEDDGKGGWTDQGPQADIRSFDAPAGVSKLNGVPFRIERPLSCIVLSSKYRKGGLESVEIPVGAKADAIFFLQSCAWTSPRQHASAVVEYADGSSYEIKFVGDVNMRDWVSSSPDAPFTGETDTLTCLAASFKQEKYGKASLYQTAWLNPSPEKEMKSVTLKSGGNGVPVFIAMTLASKQNAAQGLKVSSPEELKRAAAVSAKAAELQKKGLAKDAEALLKGVVKDAPDSPEAWLQLGYALEEQGKHAEAIDAYRSVVRCKPQLFEPYLRIGKCHEALGQYREAAETYRESLRMDINQPDVMAALDAVKKKL